MTNQKPLWSIGYCTGTALRRIGIRRHHVERARRWCLDRLAVAEVMVGRVLPDLSTGAATTPEAADKNEHGTGSAFPKATGDVLDKIGTIWGVARRPTEPDESYRTAITRDMLYPIRADLAAIEKREQSARNFETAKGTPTVMDYDHWCTRCGSHTRFMSFRICANCGSDLEACPK